MTDVNSESCSKGECEVVEKSEDEKIQKITTDLRLDFLKILTHLEGKEASFNLYKRKDAASGTFSGSDRDVLHFAVSNFESPTGLMTSATLRTTDIDCMTVPLVIEDNSDITLKNSKTNNSC